MSSLVESFRENRLGRSAQSGRERIVVNLVCAWAVVLPWLIGGRLWWAQALGAAVGAVALGVAAGTAENRRVLWRFPVFWLGLAFLIYVLCQALNPWIEAQPYAPGAFTWYVFTVDHIKWLPAGVRADYFEMNTWRVLVYWLGPWLLVCAWWTAVRRRRSGRQLAWLVFANGVLTALVVLAEGMNPPDKVFGFYTEPGLNLEAVRAVGAAFTYRNAAGVFLYLSLGTGFSLACALQARVREEGHDTGLTWAVLLGCLIILASYFVLGSRAGLSIAAALFFAGLVILLGAGIVAKASSPGLWVGAIVLLLGLGALGLYEFRSGESWTLIRWAYRIGHPEDDVRGILRQQTLLMVHDRPWLGFGGGSYRYISPIYFRANGIFTDPTAIGGLSQRANQAHSDWLQLPMEFGLVGAGFLLAILLYWYGSALRRARWLGAAGWMIMLSATAMLVHATVDFPTYNAAVLTLFSLLLASTLKTAALEERRAAA